MKEIYFIIMVTLLMAGCAQQRPAKDCPTYAEAADPSPDQEAAWSAVKPGLHASLGSADRLYAKSAVPEAEIGRAHV